jgi:hypothetical protein
MRRALLEVEVVETYVRAWGISIPHIKVHRRDGKSGISWDDLQAIKEEYFPGSMAIEVYPPGDDVVDEANIRHLWICPPGINMPSLHR